MNARADAARKYAARRSEFKLSPSATDAESVCTVLLDDCLKSDAQRLCREILNRNLGISSTNDDRNEFDFLRREGSWSPE
jgi:hypothetical protein